MLECWEAHANVLPPEGKTGKLPKIWSQKLVPKIGPKEAQKTWRLKDLEG